jgi:hypothetical protein
MKKDNNIFNLLVLAVIAAYNSAKFLTCAIGCAMVHIYKERSGGADDKDMMIYGIILRKIRQI